MDTRNKQDIMNGYVNSSVRKESFQVKMRRYLYRIMIAISVLFNVILGGPSNQTFSARNHAWRRKGHPNVCSFIDVLFFMEADHCRMSWLYWRTRKDVIHSISTKEIQE